jgi:uracil phosphoribosyltransferase
MNKITVLADKNSVIQQFLTEIRDKDLQKDRLRFNRNIERIGELLAYELSKDLEYIDRETETPLSNTTTQILKEQPVVAAVLRAAIPLQRGVTNIFDHADCAFISAYRNYLDDSSFEIELGYVASPDIKNRTLIFTDPMLATGKSVLLTLNSMLSLGEPKHTHIVAVVASKQGLAMLNENLKNVSFWIGAVDDTLNSHSYIVPGLGDAGDLAFGTKE